MSQIALKTHYSLAELSEMQLPGLPGTQRALLNKTKRENWPLIEVKGNGGPGGIRREYAPPAEIMKAIRSKAATSLAATMQVATVTKPSEQPALIETESQRLTADSRRGVLQAIERIMQSTHYPLKKAARVLVEMAQKGEASPQLVKMLKLARDGRGRQSPDGLPSPRSLIRFVEYEKIGTLAPKIRQRDMTVPEWAWAFLAEYRRPEKPTVAHAYSVFKKEYPGNAPSIHQVRRFIDKVGAVTLEVGRMGPNELKTIQPFIRRRFEHLLPNDIFTGDGHRFDTEVQHPLHGRPFKPELTSMISVSTRKFVGWSCGLAESALAVLDALRNAVETHGIPAILYVDNGSGYINQMMTDPATGLMSRLGIQMVNSLPYNSQARGAIERPHKTIWVRAAKELPGYVGHDMDREAKLKVYKLSRKALKPGSTETMPLMGWSQFLTFCQEKIDEYNARPHRSLEKIVDPETGRRRHMSPNEAWDKAVENGFEAHTVSDAESRPLFRPQVMRTVHRGELEVFGNRYFSKYLEEFHGDQLRIGYDVHDPEKVWIYDADGRFICTAGLDANKRDYMPKSFIEQAREKRALGREKRLQVHLEEVQAELRGAPAIDQMESVTIPGFMSVMTREQLAQRAQMAELVEHIQEPIAEALPDIVPDTPSWSVPSTQEARWAAWNELQLLTEEEITDEKQRRWRTTYQATAEFSMFQRKKAWG